jgi:hypothetical protein
MRWIEQLVQVLETLEQQRKHMATHIEAGEAGIYAHGQRHIAVLDDVIRRLYDTINAVVEHEDDDARALKAGPAAGPVAGPTAAPRLCPCLRCGKAISARAKKCPGCTIDSPHATITCFGCAAQIHAAEDPCATVR